MWEGSSCNPAGHCVPRKPVSQRHRPPCRFGRAAERARLQASPLHENINSRSPADGASAGVVWSAGLRQRGDTAEGQLHVCHLTGGGGGSKRSVNMAREGNEGNVSLEAMMDSKKPNSKRETHSTDQLLLPQPQTTWAPSKSIKEVARCAVSSAISSKRILRLEHFPST